MSAADLQVSGKPDQAPAGQAEQTPSVAGRLEALRRIAAEPVDAVDPVEVEVRSAAVAIASRLAEACPRVRMADAAQVLLAVGDALVELGLDELVTLAASSVLLAAGELTDADRFASPQPTRIRSDYAVFGQTVRSNDEPFDPVPPVFASRGEIEVGDYRLSFDVAGALAARIDVAVRHQRAVDGGAGS